MEGLPPDDVVMYALFLLFMVGFGVFLWRKARVVQRVNEGNAVAAVHPAGGLLRDPDDNCSICLYPMVNPVQTNCGHWFCARCILDHADFIGVGRVNCPFCRQEVTMLVGEADGPENAAPMPQDIVDKLAVFSARNLRRGRSLWQAVRDAPLLLRRLWSDVRHADGIQTLAEMLQRGVKLKMLLVIAYIISPVDFFSENIHGVIGFIDDILIALVFLIQLSAIYRSILLAANATAGGPPAAGAPAAPNAPIVANNALGAAVAAATAVVVGTVATATGIDPQPAMLAALAGGAFAAAML